MKTSEKSPNMNERRRQSSLGLEGHRQTIGSLFTNTFKFRRQSYPANPAQCVPGKVNDLSFQEADDKGIDKPRAEQFINIFIGIVVFIVFTMLYLMYKWMA